MNDPRCAMVIGASSEIGAALSHRWLGRGWTLAGTYRTPSPSVEGLRQRGMALVACDLADEGSMSQACAELRRGGARWDVLAVCPGTLEPIGKFLDCRFEEWEASVQVNFMSQMRLIHELLPLRRPGSSPGPCVLFFAGGGTNSAPVNYSAYTLSKIALIKMCELLDAEVTDTRFVIVGPGVVQTKIHHATVHAGARAGEHYHRAVEALAGRRCVPMEQVLECCDWVVGAPRQVVSGRNISAAHDPWGTPALERLLLEDAEMYKLRRCGNDRLARGTGGLASLAHG